MHAEELLTAFIELESAIRASSVKTLRRSQNEMPDHPVLSPCPDCGNPVSTSAAACPKCGRKLKQTAVGVLAVVLLVLVSAWVIYFVSVTFHVNPIGLVVLLLCFVVLYKLRASVSGYLPAIVIATLFAAVLQPSVLLWHERTA